MLPIIVPILNSQSLLVELVNADREELNGDGVNKEDRTHAIDGSIHGNNHLHALDEVGMKANMRVVGPLCASKKEVNQHKV